MKKTVVITMDIDWAPDEVVQYAFDILNKYQIKATIFMTHKMGVGHAPHEIGIHPNFTSIDFEKHLVERLDDFPGIKGARSHSLLFSERFRPLYEKYNIEYDSNSMRYKQKNILPYLISPSVVEIPLFWMDNFCLEMEGDYPDYSIDTLDMASEGIKLFNFHPVHVFLNTCSLSEYFSAKVDYHNAGKLQHHRNTKRNGTKDFLITLLEYIKSNNLEVKTLGEINQEFRKTHKIKTT